MTLRVHFLYIASGQVINIYLLMVKMVWILRKTYYKLQKLLLLTLP